MVLPGSTPSNLSNPGPEIKKADSTSICSDAVVGRRRPRMSQRGGTMIDSEQVHHPGTLISMQNLNKDLAYAFIPSRHSTMTYMKRRGDHATLVFFLFSFFVLFSR